MTVSAVMRTLLNREERIAREAAWRLGACLCYCCLGDLDPRITPHVDRCTKRLEHAASARDPLARCPHTGWVCPSCAPGLHCCFEHGGTE